jgi:hypothetical protein
MSERDKVYVIFPRTVLSLTIRNARNNSDRSSPAHAATADHEAGAVTSNAHHPRLRKTSFANNPFEHKDRKLPKVAIIKASDLVRIHDFVVLSSLLFCHSYSTSLLRLQLRV